MAEDDQTLHEAARQLVRLMGLAFGTLSIVVQGGRAREVNATRRRRLDEPVQGQPESNNNDLITYYAQQVAGHFGVTDGQIDLTIHQGAVTAYRPSHVIKSQAS